MRAGLAVVAGLCVMSLPALAHGPSGTFRGTYTCSPGQGVTGDTSTFIVDKRNNVKLIQVVYPIPGGSVFPTGAFELRGTYSPQTRTYSFYSVTKLGQDGYWLPASLPNLHTLSKDGQSIKRLIVNPGCSQDAPYTRLWATTPAPPAAAPMMMPQGSKGQS
ncbi:MAG: hypothetical protein WAS21_32550 [Geminicoccaceae bacterium]